MPMPDVSLPELAGKAVMITGASTGIGAALARAFAGQRARGGLHFYASVEAAEALAGEIRDGGGTVELVRANAADPEELRTAVDTIAGRFGGLDGLINNAGGMVKRVTYEDATDEDYAAVIDLNARSVVAASRPRSRT
jgi:3-oxoacyl-[acyl-carrier protein] reductase